MFGDVSESFLKNAEQGKRGFFVGIDLVRNARCVANEPHSLGKVVGQGLDGGCQAEILENARAQFAGNATSRADGLVDQTFDGAYALAQ